MHVAIVQRKTADRRKDRRFPMRGAIDMRAAGIDILIQATLEDISATGCRVSTRAPLRLKHPVRMELPRPGQTPLRITGNVVRARGANADRLHHYGIFFRFESAEARAEMRAYVSLYASKLAPVRTAVDRRNAAAGVDVKLPLDVSVPRGWALCCNRTGVADRWNAGRVRLRAAPRVADENRRTASGRRRRAFDRNRARESVARRAARARAIRARR